CSEASATCDAIILEEVGERYAGPSGVAINCACRSDCIGLTYRHRWWRGGGDGDRDSRLRAAVGAAVADGDGNGVAGGAAFQIGQRGEVGVDLGERADDREVLRPGAGDARPA